MTKFNELLTHKVAILNADTQAFINTMTVEGIASGFGLYLEDRDGTFYLRDYQDDEYEWELGTGVREALQELNNFIYYFNDLDGGDDYDGWESDFLYYYKD